MDEIEFLIFRMLVETNQLRHFVKGWTVTLEFPELDFSIMLDRGEPVVMRGTESRRLAQEHGKFLDEVQTAYDQQ